MLERVSLGQTRFSTPGVAVDARGVVLGRLGLFVFPALDGVVGWLRLYAGEGSLDELLPGMKILKARTALRARAFLLVVPVASSYVLDRGARCARLVGGATFTGSARQFVRYRDDRSPYGYDLVDPQPVPPGADVVLADLEGVQAYASDGELDAKQLVLRLSLRRVPGSERLDTEARAELYLAVPRGLGDGVLRYLWRNRVQAEVALVTPAAVGEFSARGAAGGATGPGGGAYLLVRAHDLPTRILEGFLGIPGIAIFRARAENVAVEVGFEHPIELSSCLTLFDRTRFFLFRGDRDGAETIAQPVEFVDAARLTEVRLPDATDPSARAIEAAATSGPAAEIGVSLRLAPSLAPPRRVIGAFVPWVEAPRLKKLVYALPPVLLRGHRIATTDRGILLVAREGVDIVPIGTLLAELAPGLLVPVGMDLLPRVAPEVLAHALGHGAGRQTVFLHDGPFFVKEEALGPLERRAVAKLEVPEARGAGGALALPGDDPHVVNDPVGAFALWGFPAPRAPGTAK